MDGGYRCFFVIAGTTCISVVVAMGLFQKRKDRLKVLDKINQKQRECKQAFDVVEKQLEYSNVTILLSISFV